MSFSASLSPRRLESRLEAGLAAWCLNVPASLSETGKRQRLFFDTEREALVKAEELKTRRHNFGASLGSLTSAQIVKAADSYALLEEFPEVDLHDAVLHYRDLLRQRASSIPFKKLFDLYLSKIQKRSEEHRTSMRQTRDRFPSLHPMLACDITHHTLDELLLGVSPASRDLILRHWKSVFQYGIKREYLSANPIQRMDFAGSAPKEVEIYDVSAVEVLLVDALSNDLELLPFYIFGFLCGIRPEKELEGLDWRYVHLDRRKQVAIPATISKTRKYREVDLSSNAIAWLREYRARGGKMQGKVIEWEHENLRKHRKASAGRLNIKWIQDGMRHSFASYWLPAHHDIDKLMVMMGHVNPDTFSKHYHAGVPRKEAVKYWKIRPPQLPKSTGRKIIPFKRAA